jgi:hypothetical protein
MSEDKKIILRQSKDKIDIYAISTSPNSVELLLYISIINLPERIHSIKMYSNIIYFRHDTQLMALDILNSNVSQITMDSIVDYYVHKGIVCALHVNNIAIITNIDGTQYKFDFRKMTYRGSPDPLFKDGKLYIYGTRNIHVLDIETNKCISIKDRSDYKTIFPTTYGLVFVTEESIVLPSGKSIGFEDFQLPKGRAQIYLKNVPRNGSLAQIMSWFIDTNYDKDILICGVQLRTREAANDIVIIINLNNETIIKCLNFNPVPGEINVGFISPESLKPMETIIIDYEKI